MGMGKVRERGADRSHHIEWLKGQHITRSEEISCRVNGILNNLAKYHFFIGNRLEYPKLEESIIRSLKALGEDPEGFYKMLDRQEAYIDKMEVAYKEKIGILGEKSASANKDVGDVFMDVAKELKQRSDT